MTILGTRPEIIRLSATIRTLEQHTQHILVHTGQNYDYQLNQVFFEELGLSQPDHFLGVDTSSLGRTLGGILTGTEEVLMKERPDAVLVLGDTNSALALMMAKRMKIPTYHMEAGNRCFDANVPEEINRRIVDHTADFNLVYTEHARRHLLAEGIHPRFIYLTGSPMREVLQVHRSRIEASPILDKLGLKPRSYFIVSVHREENVDSRINLQKVMDALTALHDRLRLPVIVSTHPRTRKRLDTLTHDLDKRDIRFLEPFGFFDYNHLQMQSFCAISDSGTISEESAILNFPAVSLRTAIERPEALDTGSMMLTGLDSATVLSAVDITVSAHVQNMEIPPEYCVTNTSLRVAKLITGTAKLAHRWRNMEDFSRYDWD